MASRVRPEEQFAEEVLRRVLAIAVTGRDDGSSNRMVDVLFTLPDGTEGALEVTTIGEQNALELEAIAAKKSWRVEGSTWTWVVYAGRGTTMRDLERHLPSLVTTCEALGVADPRVAPHDARQLPAFRWLEGVDVSMHGFASTTRPGAIDVLPDGDGGAVFEHLDELPQWLGARLREPDLEENIDKLRTTGRTDLHLFLRIHDTGMPFSLYYPLATTDHLPPSPLDAPSGLTGLWLAPRWKNPTLWWSSGLGWRRADCVD